MTKKEKKEKAQDLIMHQLSIIGYGNDYEEYVKEVGDEYEAWEILKQQADRVAKLMGYEEAWFG